MKLIYNLIYYNKYTILYKRYTLKENEILYLNFF